MGLEDQDELSNPDGVGGRATSCTTTSGRSGRARQHVKSLPHAQRGALQWSVCWLPVPGIGVGISEQSPLVGRGKSDETKRSAVVDVLCHNLVRVVP